MRLGRGGGRGRGGGGEEEEEEVAGNKARRKCEKEIINGKKREWKGMNTEKRRRPQKWKKIGQGEKGRSNYRKKHSPLLCFDFIQIF